MLQGYISGHVVLDNRILSLILTQDKSSSFLLSTNSKDTSSLPNITFSRLIPFSARIDILTANHDEIIQLGVDLCYAVIFLQQHNVIHAAIEPGCLYYTDSGSYVLAGASLSDDTDVFPGKSFSAPELLAGDAYGSTVDLFSIGRILYELSVRACPDNSFSRLREIAQRACAPDRNERYFSAVQMRQDLDALRAFHSGRLSVRPGDFPAQQGRPSLLVQSTGEKRTLSGSSFRVGRGSDCDLALSRSHSNRSISRHHLMIFEQGGVWYVEDTDSKNGTQLNGISLFPHAVYPLRGNDVITLAHTEQLVFLAA